MIVTVKKSLAVICFLGQCYPALVGEATPNGEYTLNKRKVVSEGYGGDVLQFYTNNEYVYAIHRPYSLDKKRDRDKMLMQSPSSQRTMTKGCINVQSSVYDILYQNSQKIKLIIQF